jgi:hypothetical protein
MKNLRSLKILSPGPGWTQGAWIAAADAAEQQFGVRLTQEVNMPELEIQKIMRTMHLHGYVALWQQRVGRQREIRAVVLVRATR